MKFHPVTAKINADLITFGTSVEDLLVLEGHQYDRRVEE